MIVVAGLGLACMPAFAQTPAVTDKIKTIAATEPAETVPDLALGDDLAITCDAIEMVANDSEVRVVLTIAAMPGETATGYKRVLATDEHLDRGAVRVKVPRAPGLANHTVNLNVYVDHAGHNQDCNGGHYKIVDTGIAAKPKG